MFTTRRGGQRLPGHRRSVFLVLCTNFVLTGFHGRRGNTWYVLLSCCVVVLLLVALLCYVNNLNNLNPNRQKFE